MLPMHDPDEKLLGRIEIILAEPPFVHFTAELASVGHVAVKGTLRKGWCLVLRDAAGGVVRVGRLTAEEQEGLRERCAKAWAAKRSTPWDRQRAEDMSDA